MPADLQCDHIVKVYEYTRGTCANMSMRRVHGLHLEYIWDVSLTQMVSGILEDLQ